MNKIVTCEGCGIKYYSETIVPRESFRHVYPDIVKLETKLSEARAEIERLKAEIRDNNYLAARQIVPAEMAVDDLRAELERKNVLIEQMREALNVLVASATPSGPLWHGSAEMQIARAALSAAERERNDR